jgi:hypothetical protein
VISQTHKNDDRNQMQPQRQRQQQQQQQQKKINCRQEKKKIDIFTER